MAKKPAKKTEQDVTSTDSNGGSVAVAERPHLPEPFEWIGDWFDHWPAMFGRRFPDMLERGLGAVEAMKVEEFDDDDETVIRVEIPGVDPEEDIDISVTGGRLVVSATRERRTTEEGNGRRSEFHYGKFRRAMTLPPGVEAEDVKAFYTDGILEIRVPADGKAQAKTKVAITRSD